MKVYTVHTFVNSTLNVICSSEDIEEVQKALNDFGVVKKSSREYSSKEANNECNNVCIKVNTAVRFNDSEYDSILRQLNDLENHIDDVIKSIDLKIRLRRFE